MRGTESRKKKNKDELVGKNASLKGAQAADSILVGVSPMLEYYWGASLVSILHAADRANNGKGVRKVTFLLADSLQQHTFAMKRVFQDVSFKHNLRGQSTVEAKRRYIEQHFPAKSHGDVAKQMMLGAKQAMLKAIEQGAPWDEMEAQLEGIYDNASAAHCLAKAGKMGARWLTQFNARLHSSIQDPENSLTHPEIFLDVDRKSPNIRPWNELIRASADEFRTLQDAYSEKKEDFRAFNDVVDNMKLALMTRYENKLPPPNHGLRSECEELMGSHCLQYILKESAVIWKLVKEEAYQGLAYPFTQSQESRLLLECIRSINVGLRKRHTEEGGEHAAPMMAPVSIVFEADAREASDEESSEEDTNVAVARSLSDLMRMLSCDDERPPTLREINMAILLIATSDIDSATKTILLRSYNDLLQMQLQERMQQGTQQRRNRSGSDTSGEVCDRDSLPDSSTSTTAAVGRRCASVPLALAEVSKEVAANASASGLFKSCAEAAVELGNKHGDRRLQIPGNG